VVPGFEAAAGVFREAGIPFWLAVTLTQCAEWLAGQGRAGEGSPLLDEAGVIFARLKATPWLDRVERIAGSQVTSKTGS
jgi:hypothetical protein